jgi:hypothetical protein
MTRLQAETLLGILELELSTGFKMARGESGLQVFRRLTGVDAGKGKKGLENAIATLQEALK